jgi:hypothetical protein
VDDAGWEMDEGGCPVTPERLDYLANLYAGHTPATELVAEIRRLWKVRDAARKMMDEEQPHPCPDYALRAMYRDQLRDALAAYDAAADRHPGQMGLGEGQS